MDKPIIAVQSKHYIAQQNILQWKEEVQLPPTAVTLIPKIKPVEHYPLSLRVSELLLYIEKANARNGIEVLAKYLIHHGEEKSHNFSKIQDRQVA